MKSRNLSPKFYIPYLIAFMFVPIVGIYVSLTFDSSIALILILLYVFILAVPIWVMRWKDGLFLQYNGKGVSAKRYLSLFLIAITILVIGLSLGVWVLGSKLGF